MCQYGYMSSKQTPVIKYRSVEFDLNGVQLKASSKGVIFYKAEKKWIRMPERQNDSGYKLCWINKRHYRTHRLVYKAFHPEWDLFDVSKDNQIDHRDQCKDNNRLSNLRIADNSQNLCNRGAQANSRTGVKGVCAKYVSARDTWQWCIQIYKGGVEYKKRIKAGDGKVPTALPPIPQRIMDIRNAMIRRHHGEFAFLD